IVCMPFKARISSFMSSEMSKPKGYRYNIEFKVFSGARDDGKKWLLFSPAPFQKVWSQCRAISSLQ
ncbi:MAG: hypothetical protein M1411_02415, partial [Candidatus Thermoplasmatota archaeon]|nr:hypothetical protein [Candidatus Thermoplasmatota archaeon]